MWQPKSNSPDPTPSGVAGGPPKQVVGNEHAGLLDWDQLPEWQKDNHYVRTQYRPCSGSYYQCFLSLAVLHNETVNIHSHLLGATLFLTLLVQDTLAPSNTLPLIPFYTGTIGCLAMSSAFHAISNHSHAVASNANKLDYAGIVALIWGSFVSSLYYGFNCHKSLRAAYVGMITLIGAGCLYTSLKSKFRTPAYRPFRSGMFVAMGLSAILPVLHGLSLHGWTRLDDLISARWLISQGGLYILGAGIYAARTPERWAPGRFDVWGSSHQMFHALVVGAAWVHWWGLVEARHFHESWPEEVRCSL